MVSLADALAYLRPDALPLRDYALADDGTGPRVAWWDAGAVGPQPTAEEVAAVTPGQVAALAVAKATAAAGATFGSLDAVPIATRCAIRVICDRVNAAFAEMGRPKPLLEADVAADLAAGLAAGLGLPQRPEGA
jgi:hypothetical protein